MTIDQAMQMAIGHHRAGQLPAAESIYTQILTAEPRHAGALHLLGLLNFQIGRPGVAVGLLEQAIANDPKLADAYCDLGNVLNAVRRPDAAIAALSKAIELKPDHALAHYNLGIVLMEQEKFDAAAAAYSRAIELAPQYTQAIVNLGIVLSKQGKYAEAIAAYSRAIQINPDWASTYCNLGEALLAQHQYGLAANAFSRAIELNPEFAEAYSNLGNALCELGKLDEGVEAYRRALALKPDLAEAHMNLATPLNKVGKTEEAIESFRRAIALDPGNSEYHSNLCLCLHYRPEVTAEMLLAEHVLWNNRHAEPVAKFIQPHTNDRSARRRLKIGYVSPDFRNHAVAQMLLPLLANHDHQAFEIFCYSNTPRTDEVTERIKRYADHWRDIFRMSDDDAAGQIRRDQIDILVDLAAHTAGNRLLIFARKPAPIQATFFPGTTGVKAIDYRIIDPYFDPPGEAEPYTEKTLRLKSLWCFEPRDERPVNPLPAISNGYVTFASFNNPNKINPQTLQTWIAIMRAVPNSRLLFKMPPGKHLEEIAGTFLAGGISADRLEFIPKQPEDRYFQLFNRIDIGLDPFPFTGHTTTFDFLWMGVPVVSLHGKTCVGRAAVSVLSILGIPEFIARTPEEYVEIAVRYAKDPAYLAGLRASVRQRMIDSPLMDARGYARDWESLFREMWGRHFIG